LRQIHGIRFFLNAWFRLLLQALSFERVQSLLKQLILPGGWGERIDLHVASFLLPRRRHRRLGFVLAVARRRLSS
jgi:uncharacterized membrane protein